MKKIVGLMIIGGMIFAGCSGGNSSSQTAKQKYDSFTKKYSHELKDLNEAFPSDSKSPDDLWKSEIESACGPQDNSSDGFALMIFGPLAAKYGHSVVDLMKEGKAVDQAVRDEGLCSK